MQLNFRQIIAGFIPRTYDVLGTLSKLTRRPRGGGQQANLHSIGVKGRVNSVGLLNGDLLVGRRVSLVKVPIILELRATSC